MKLLDDGARDYVVKPFSEKELMVRVRNAVHAEQARAQMQVLHAAAESANRAKDEFLAMLGHELRNPLAPILTALQLMKLRGEAGSERERVIIERQVTHLSRLVDDLLDVSRIARGQDRAQAGADRHRRRGGARRSRCRARCSSSGRTGSHVEVPRRDCASTAIRTRLSQVISNLLTNAAKYTPPGGDITVRGEARRMTCVQVSVRDTGIGIAAGHAAAHLRPVRAGAAGDRAVAGRARHRPHDRAQPRRAARRHGVGAQRRSREGQRVRRPPAGRGGAGGRDLVIGTRGAGRSDPAGIDTRRASSSSTTTKTRRSCSQRCSCRKATTRASRSTPRRRCELAAEMRPDVAILDIGLPVMDGYELAAHLRARQTSATSI